MGVYNYGTVRCAPPPPDLSNGEQLHTHAYCSQAVQQNTRRTNCFDVQIQRIKVESSFWTSTSRQITRSSPPRHAPFCIPGNSGSRQDAARSTMLGIISRLLTCVFFGARRARAPLVRARRAHMASFTDMHSMQYVLKWHNAIAYRPALVQCWPGPSDITPLPGRL